MKPSSYRFAAAVFFAAAISGCVQSTPQIGIKSGQTPRDLPVLVQPSLVQPGPIDNGATSGAESFSESAYGVSASPIVARGSRMPRGGGYQKLGSPYTVKGKRYYPTENPESVQYGRASWYGTAFHGRKTANGEVYDMNHLSGAHKTMPLPSYARVTNVRNGHSVIVRINDRGPFSNNRVIDLSKRAAELLDYTLAGTAEVKVEYVGPAPLHGQDDEYLLSSIQGIDGITTQNPLPGVNNDIMTVSTVAPKLVRKPRIPVNAYVSMRINNAFDVYKTERPNFLWKRINSID